MPVSCICLVVTCAVALTHASPVWSPEPRNSCPDIPAQKNLALQQVAGDWRLAYLFLGRDDEGEEEEQTCVVTSIVPTSDPNKLELSLFIDTLRNDHVDRAAVQFPADVFSAGEWKIYTPLSSGGYLRARVIRATKDHLVVSFCGQYPLNNLDYDDPEGHLTPTEAPTNWKSFFEDTRRKRSVKMDGEEMHVWTAVLVKHNDISALKFVEYAALLMKHGYDVTKGELVSFGKCPVDRPHGAAASHLL